MRFPGRRGQAEAVDFHLHPLRFAAAVGLKRSLSSQELLQLAQPRAPLSQETEQVLLEEFLAYLTGPLRPQTLKQIGRYANSRILARQSAPASIGGIPVEFLPQTLLRLDLEKRT